MHEFNVNKWILNIGMVYVKIKYFWNSNWIEYFNLLNQLVFGLMLHWSKVVIMVLSLIICGPFQ